MTGLLQRAVLRTRHLPVLSSLYRGVYTGAVEACARSLGSLPGVRSVLLHRGMSRPGWEPGLSDIDLIVIHEPLETGAQEWSFLNKVAGRLTGLRRLFPMLGDLWLGTPAELETYQRWGGLRVWEDAPDWKLLAGRPVERVPLAENERKRRWLDAWVWLFQAHLEISRRRFGLTKEAPERRDAHTRKLFVDVCRYAEFLQDPAPGARLVTRAEARAGLEGLELIPAHALWLDSSLRLAEASRRVLAAAGASAGRLRLDCAPDAQAQALLDRLPGIHTVLIDAPYHAYLLFSGHPSRWDYAAAAEALEACALPVVPLALDPDSWSLLLQSSYVGGPQGLRKGATPGLRGCGWRDHPIVLLSERDRWEVAAEAASWTALWRRSLEINPRYDDRFKRAHLERAASISLGV